MTIDFSATPDDRSLSTGSDAPFAGVPAWERGKKRRGFGAARRSAEPSSFAASTDPLLATDLTSAVDATDPNFAAGPTFADRVRKPATSRAPVAIVAGLILVGGVAAVLQGFP